jgi:hypothetical protein
MAALALLCAMTSCSTSPTTQPPAPAATSAPAGTAPTQSAACTDALALASSLEALGKLDLAQDGVPAMRTAVADVKAKLQTAEASARAAFGTSLAQVQTAFAAVQSATSSLTADNRREKAPEIVAALRQLSTATAALSSKLTEGCPSR